LTDRPAIERLFEMLQFSRASSSSSFEAQNAALEAADDFFGSSAPKPKFETVVDADGTEAVLVVPEAADLGTCIIYFHGGGYCIGSPKSERGLVLRIAKSLSVPVLVPDYRKAPSHPAPAAVIDASRCIGWVAGGGLADVLPISRGVSSDVPWVTGMDPADVARQSLGDVDDEAGSDEAVGGSVVGKQAVAGRIILGGSSAGAGLAIAAYLYSTGKHHVESHGDARPNVGAELDVEGRIVGIFSITGWFDVSNSSPSIRELEGKDPLLDPQLIESFASAYVPSGMSRKDPLVSPLYADLSSLPPVRLDWAGRDSLRDDSRRMYEALDKAGIPVEGLEWEQMPHIFPYFEPVLEEAQRYLYSELPSWFSRLA
jgi:monoterpene epsilon-lactone hydrolase